MLVFAAISIAALGAPPEAPDEGADFAAELEIADSSRILRSSEPDEGESSVVGTIFPDREWLVEFEPAVWFPAFDGDIALPSGPLVSFSRLDIEDPEASPYAEFSLRRDRWTLKFSGFGVSGDETATAGNDFTIGRLDIAAGQRVDTEIDYISLEALALYRVWREELPDGKGGGVAMRLDVGGGVRYHDLDLRVAFDGGRQSADDRFAEPVLAVALSVDLSDQIDFGVSGSVGWLPIEDQSSFSADIVAGIRWRPVRNVGVQFGFRHFVANLDSGDDDFEFEGSLSGLFASLVIRF